MLKSRISLNVFEKNLKDNFHANSLDSLANSSNQSESLSDDSHDSDSGADTKSKNSFAVSCEVYAQSGCGSIRSWTKSDCNSESSYECVNNDKKDCEKRLDTRMETIPEETEPKVSVKAILARFENLNENKDRDCTNTNCHNNNNVNNQPKLIQNHCATPSSPTHSSNKTCSNGDNVINPYIPDFKKIVKITNKEEHEVRFIWSFSFV